jgi:uncharacterized ferritin-like protein (DUF455 family)
MDVHALATRTLTGTTLADKLAPWTDWTDAGRGAPVPDEPGRPAALVLPTHRRPAGAPVSLDRPDGRARVLHELANHELQAIELLCVALLRWPDLPAGFRRGLIATLHDEQRHCALYVDRLRACGGSLGEQPVSRFFWDALARVDSPEAFVAGLSLCFEQANLDYCRHWRERFAEAGDHETAAVLDQVYADEIRHVAHGRVWFGRWSAGDGADRPLVGEALVDAWQAALPAPLTPARARGVGFDRPGRRAAGLSDEAIDAFRVAGGSRGRPGRAVWFDAGVEDVLATGQRSAMARAVNTSLATLPMFLVRREDVVVAPRPSVAFLARLADAGFEIPRFSDAPDAVQPVPVERVEPWGPCPDPLFDGGVPWEPRWAALSSKVESQRHAMTVLPDHPAALPPMARGRIRTTLDRPMPEGPWVLKAPFSASGTRRIRGQGAPSPEHQRWLARALDRWGAVVEQPWYTRVVDLSVHVSVSDDGSVKVDGWTRFLTDAHGAFRGTVLGPDISDLPPAVRQFLHGSGRRKASVFAALDAVGEAAGAWAASLGLRGAVSVDAAVVDTPDGLRLHPWLETNGRSTLGRVGLALGRVLAPRSTGVWRVERATDSQRRALRAAPMPTMQDGRLRSGVLPTTEPTDQAALLTWIEVR